MRLALPATLAALALALAGAPAAHATTYYVNQSAPGANNAGACTTPAAPCGSIFFGLTKATVDGDVVKVLPDPNGFTDTYNDPITLGPAKVRLEGAGTGTGGTRIVPFAGSYALTIDPGSTATDLAVDGTNATEAAINNGGTAQRILAEAPTANTTAARCVGGTILDSRLTGFNGVRMRQCTIARSRIEAQVYGVRHDDPGTPNQVISGNILNSTIAGSPDFGIGINAVAGVVPGTITLRHVAITGFSTRVKLSQNEVDATNTSIAGSPTSIDLDDNGAKVSFIAVDRSPARTVLANSPTIEEANPIDLPPDFTADGHLPASSPLRDRGVTTGYLAGDPLDATDIDGEARLQGAAPDIGPDELPAVPAPVTGGGPGAPTTPTGPATAGDMTAPTITGLRLAASFRTACPKRARRAAATACRPGLPLAFSLSEPATLRLAFTTIPAKKGARPVTRSATLRAKAGKNTLRFSGRIGKRTLDKGRYRLTVTAVDAAGNVSAPVSRAITVR